MLGTRLRGFDRDFLRVLAIGARAEKVVLGEVLQRERPIGPSPGQRIAVGHDRNIRALNTYSDPDYVVRGLPLAFPADQNEELVAFVVAPSVREGEISGAATPAPADCHGHGHREQLARLRHYAME